MTAEPRFVRGRELVIGDVIYSLGGNGTITSFREYEGGLWPEGARIARLAHGVEITIPDAELIAVYGPERGDE